MDLSTLAGDLGRRRTHFPARAAFAAVSLSQLAERLDAFVREKTPAGTLSARRQTPRILMVFGGQGTQWAGCGRELYDTEPVFRRAVDAVDAAWPGQAGFSLRDACFTASQEDQDEVRLAQPVIFMIEAALTELLRAWGVSPDGVIGHSAGEVAAANAAGACSLEEATRLTYHRAVLQQRTAGSGRMLAVSLNRAGLEELLRGNIAFHSRAMDVIEADLRASLAFLDGRPPHPRLPFFSSVTGEVTQTLDGAYWWSNIRRPVRFMAAVRTAARELRPDVVLEVSPHMALTPGRPAVPGRPGPADGLRAHPGPGRGSAAGLASGAGGAVPRGRAAGLRGAVPAGPAGQPPAAAA